MGTNLKSELKKIAVDAARAYFEAGPVVNGATAVEYEKEADAKRITIIEDDLKPLVTKYLEKRIPLIDFKRRIDGVNKQNKLWGFSGIKG